jgi:type II secretory pathway pseudopilin PulG
MKTPRRSRRSAFTLVEVMISMTVTAAVLAMAMSNFMMMMRTMYKDNQRLATNASLRSFMAQISKETLDASYFYLFSDYSKLDGSVNLETDPVVLSQSADYTDNEYDRWVGHGDCLVLVTKTSVHRTTDIRQIRIYYRRARTQAERNVDAPLRYYETQDWGEGTAGASNGHLVEDLSTYLNAINLNSATTGASYNATGMAYNPAASDLSGSKLLCLRTRGRLVPPPYSPFQAGDRYPVFSSESPSANPTNGFISINTEFINGTGVTNMLSSSSFNYTISPRR